MWIRTEYGFQIQIPSILYNYKIIEEIGKDQYAAILKVQDMNTEEYYRAKIYLKSSMQYSCKVKMIHNEIKILRSISHPNITHLHEYFNIKNEKGEKLTVLIEDYYSNITLLDYIKRKRFIDEKERRKILYGILQAIDYLHQNHIAHLNIRPEVIYLDEDLNPKLSGFGASQYLGPKFHIYDYSYHHGYNITKEEMNYEAPFCYLYGYISLSKYKEDIWSFGILFFYITEKRFPFHTFDEVKKCSKDSLKTSCEVITRIVQQCVRYDLKERPDAHQLLNDPYFMITDQ